MEGRREGAFTCAGATSEGGGNGGGGSSRADWKLETDSEKKETTYPAQCFVASHRNRKWRPTRKLEVKGRETG